LGLGPHGEWDHWEAIEAMMPEASLHGFDAELRSLSQGLATFTAAFDHLAELGGKQAEDIVKARALIAA
jgi:elongation factor G